MGPHEQDHDPAAANAAPPGDEAADRDEPARGPAPPAEQPVSQRRGIALCLSGGGFRAALFHLGALTRLNELGVLAQIDAFSCVSGGSIVGGLLARSIAQGMRVEGGRYTDWDLFTERLIDFTRQDIRTRSVLAQLAFWRWRVRGRGARRLERYYEPLMAHLRLDELPRKLRFVFCATDLVFANAWVAERSRVGDYQTGYLSPPPPHWTLAKAVAASSCFPPVFTPLPPDIAADEYQKPWWISESDFQRDAHLRAEIRLTDGGVYDNLGVEPVWRRHHTVLVSDGGKPLQSRHVPPGLRLMRYSQVVQNQVNSLRRRWLIDTFLRAQRTGVDSATFTGAYWGISSAAERYLPGGRPTFGYSKLLADAVIANIRTDLDPFSPNEIHVLIKHGYELADVAVTTHLREVVHFPDAPRRTWPAPLHDEQAVRQALAHSSRLRLVRLSRRHHADGLLR